MISRFPFRLSILPARGRSRRFPRSWPVLLAGALTALPLRAEVTELDRPALETLLERGVPVIDVRREDEWRSRGVLEGSHLRTFFDAKGRYDVEAWLETLAEIAAPDEPFVLICAHGVRSKRIADLLDSRLGYTAVHNVTDGIEGWRESGGEVEPYAP